jgi:hypothetical protein
MSEDEKKPVVYEVNAEKWKAMTPHERLQHANQLHKQMLAAMQEEEDSTQQTEE